jgi:glycosyl transferase, family 25
MGARVPSELIPIQILVISLPGAEARRRLMRAQLELSGMPPYRFIDAVDGRGLAGPQLAALYDDAAARSRVGRPLTGAEIGCAASHLEAYRRIAEADTGVTLVLEDDALLGHQFLDVLRRVVAMIDPARPQAVLLSHVQRYSAWGARRVDRQHALYRPYSAYGAHAYLITLAAARAMAARLDRVRTAADDWAHFAKAGLLELSALVPYVVGTSPLSRHSQIGDQRLAWPGRPSASRWARFWNKLAFQLLIKPVFRLRRDEQTW